MKLREILKQNSGFRRFIKKIKIFYEYFQDAVEFSRYYMESHEKRNVSIYRMMLLIHGLEKGMCIASRPFGQKKCLQLIKILKRIGEFQKNRSEYGMSLGILQSWLMIFEANKWTDDSTYLIVRNFMKDIDKSLINDRTGFKVINKNEVSTNQYNYFYELVRTRHSIRNFSQKALSEDDVLKSVEVAIATPTACNRQMCKIYQVKRKESVNLLNNVLLGLSGFNLQTINYFIITYDISSLDFFGERHQGYFNAGLLAMNFVNALHSNCIGSCFLQWGNKRSDELLIKQKLGIANSEKIAVVIGAGYYDEYSKVTYSCRKKIDEIFSIIS